MKTIKRDTLYMILKGHEYDMNELQFNLLYKDKLEETYVKVGPLKFRRKHL